MATTLHGLDEARKEQELAETLRRAILDADELSRKISAGGISTSNAGTSTGSVTQTSRRRQDVARLCNKATEQLHEYEKSCSFKNLRRFNAAKFLDDSKQQVPLKSLMKPGDAGFTDALDRVAEAVKRLKQHPSLKNAPPSSSSSSGPHPIAQFLERGMQTLNNAITLITGTSIDANMWSNISDALLVLTEEVLGSPVTATLLDEEHETVRRMNFSVEECQQQQEQAVTDGDMKQSEVLYFKTITLQEAMVDIFNKMYAKLDEHEKESFVEPLKRVHEVHNRANSDISQIIHRNETLKQKIDGDQKTLLQIRKSLHEEDEQIQKAYSKLKAESDQYLRENLSQQEQCFAAIEDLERQLVKLGQERQEAIQKRMTAIEEESKRKGDLHQFETFFKNHKELLDNTLHHIEVAEEVTDFVDEFMCAGCNAIEQRTRQISQEIEDYRNQIHEERLKHFRHLYLTIGDLQYKKERNIEELGKKIEAAHIQQELAMDTFNPKAKEYSQAKKELQMMQEEMASQVHVLHDKAQLHIEYFKPTEAALIENGKDFVHPVQELENRNNSRKQKLLEYHKLMSDDPEATGDDAVSPTKRKQQELEEEMRMIEEERQRTQKRRPIHSRQRADGSTSSAGNSPTKADP